ncbi:hypothetical protein, partial [Klebsiella pneumoniae]|uniref:hypothetical protein n=1 Tax=Klebsiella pneumoniae TaxID=573 RepID=UPI001155FA02
KQATSEDDDSDDSIFSIIRDMDRVCTDMDLYYRRITYRFLPEYADAVQQLADSLPKQATSEDDDSDDSIFSIIRDMDRVCTDMDLYYR